MWSVCYLFRGIEQRIYNALGLLIQHSKDILSPIPIGFDGLQGLIASLVVILCDVCEKVMLCGTNGLVL